MANADASLPSLESVCREEKRAKEMELKLSSLVTANNQFKRERERLEERLTSTQVRVRVCAFLHGFI